jgi:hypothetical protein
MLTPLVSGVFDMEQLSPLPYINFFFSSCSHLALARTCPTDHLAVSEVEVDLTLQDHTPRAENLVHVCAYPNHVARRRNFDVLGVAVAYVLCLVARECLWRSVVGFPVRAHLVVVFACGSAG